MCLTIHICIEAVKTSRKYAIKVKVIRCKLWRRLLEPKRPHPTFVVLYSASTFEGSPIVYHSLLNSALHVQHWTPNTEHRAPRTAMLTPTVCSQNCIILESWKCPKNRGNILCVVVTRAWFIEHYSMINVWLTLIFPCKYFIFYADEFVCKYATVLQDVHACINAIYSQIYIFFYDFTMIYSRLSGRV